MAITRRELFLALVSALLAVALTELYYQIKSGNLIEIIFNFSNTTASLKFFLLSVMFIIGMFFIWLYGYTYIFGLNNLVRVSTAALGISLTTHVAVSGPKFELLEGVVFACIIVFISIYSLFEVYMTLKFSPKGTVGHKNPGPRMSLDLQSLRGYLDSSKVNYENLTHELRKRGIVFKKRDLTPTDQFSLAVVALREAGINTVSELDEILAGANSNVDKIQFMIPQDKSGMVLQSDLIMTIAELHNKKMI